MYEQIGGTYPALFNAIKHNPEVMLYTSSGTMVQDIKSEIYSAFKHTPIADLISVVRSHKHDKDPYYVSRCYAYHIRKKIATNKEASILLSRDYV